MNGEDPYGRMLFELDEDPVALIYLAVIDVRAVVGHTDANKTIVTVQHPAGDYDVTIKLPIEAFMRELGQDISLFLLGKKR